MSNEYFNHDTHRVNDGDTARGSDVNNPLDQVAQGFDKLPTPTQILSGKINYAVGVGVADTYTLSIDKVTAYTDGMEVVWKVPAANTGASTIDINSLGARSVRRSDGSVLSAGDLEENKITTMRFNASVAMFEIQSSTPRLTADAVAARDTAIVARNAAQASASAASTSETNAAGSASAAAGSASSASTSASNATSSASAASTSASNAGTSETNAGSSASAAASSASAASSSASAASTSQTNAGASAVAAATSASNASTSETNAAGSASSAQTAKTGAESAAALSQAWADSEGAEPGGAGTKSAKEWAAVSSVSASSVASVLSKADINSPCIEKTGGNTAQIKADTVVRLDSGSLITFATATAITMPTLTGGEDYSVWVHPDGSASAVHDPYESPATAPVTGAKKIGGFHYGLVAPGTTPAGGSFATTGFTNTGGNMVWTQADVDRIAGINEFSIWDLLWHCAGEQRGMVLDPQIMEWGGIYFCGTDHLTNGPSRFNTNVASGTVLPKIPLAFGGDGTAAYGRFSFYECHEVAVSHGLRLMRSEHFFSSAFGVTEAQSLGGASSTIPATKREPGYTSRVGWEQATGHHEVIAADVSAASASAWITGPNRGQAYGNPWMMRLGGIRTYGSYSGSRCSSSVFAAWNSYWHDGLRVAGDHVMPVGPRGSAV